VEELRIERILVVVEYTIFDEAENAVEVPLGTEN
jgi:hypothetical protein